MEIRALDVAQHEAAHVVVGVALGLRLGGAGMGPRAKRDEQGFAWFRGQWRWDGARWVGVPRRREAFALMFAAGVAWEQGLGAHRDHWVYDWRAVRELTSGRHGVETCITAAAAILAARGGIHARVTRALLERDLTGRDIEALCHGT